MQTKCRTKGRRLFRVPQAVEYLGGIVKPSTVRGWIHRRKVEVVKLNGIIAIPQEALDRMIESGRKPVAKV